MSRRTKGTLVAAGFVALIVLVGVIFGSHGANNSYQPQNDFQLAPWVPIKLGPLDMSINQAVLYLVLAAFLTVATMVYVARRMTSDPTASRPLSR